jgi:hypothetical protein
MYGVPNDLPIHRFVGDFLLELGLTTASVSLAFSRAGTIVIDGKWELLDSTGGMVARGDEGNLRFNAYHMQVILNADVTGCRLDPPRSFTLIFATGHQVMIYDDEGYESFHIYPDEIHV